MWTLPKHLSGKKPLYRQIIQLVEDSISNGLLNASERLPSERHLSELLGVNRSTVITALNELTDRGILIRKTGSGTFVNPDKWGLQASAIVNWSAPEHLIQDPYLLRAQTLRRKNAAEQEPILDLASGGIPADLLPLQTWPEFSWQTLYMQEQDDETSLLGLYSLRRAVQSYLQQKLDLNVEPEQILITSGAQQALFLISQTLLKPGDVIGVEAPSYFYLLPIFKAAGLRICALPVDTEGVTPEGLEQAAEKNQLKMIFLNPVFQNPTGYVMSRQRKKALLQYCTRKHIPIVEDDAYSLLYFNPQTDITPLKKYDQQQQIIYIGSLSKFIGKNIRVGWLIAPKAIVHKLAGIRQKIDAGLSVLPQLLAEHYLLNNINRHSEYLRTQLAAHAQQMMAWLEDCYHDEFIYTKPKGGLFIYARFTATERSGHRFNDLLNRLLAQNIIVARGADLGDKHYAIRLNYAHFVPR